ncbi:MAG TPA: substrate-binding domain-containing protein [Jatrophihabitans sp.]|jgi:ABC-type phosphate transport system substrate-binding protein
MSARSRLLLASVVTSSAVLLAGCWESSGSTGASAPSSVTPLVSAGSAVTTSEEIPTVILPVATPGEISIDGDVGTLTPQEKTSYLTSGTANDLHETFHGSDTGYTELCSGKVDMVDSAQRITTTQVSKCQANGLHVVQFEIAADAFVIAIKNETDVGGDCLTTTQVGDMFRAGSPVLTWSQLGGGYHAVALHPAGPNETNTDFDLFGAAVFDSTSPSLLNFRSAYKAFRTDDLARKYVVGKTTRGVAPKVNGRASFFRFSYYQLYEEQLRPFEISLPGTRNCIFPSAETITNGQYPFSRQYMITTTTRSLQRPEVKEFLLHYLSHATSLASAAQLVPLSQPLIDGQKDWVNGTISAPEIAPPTKSASPTAEASDQPAS